MNIKAYLLKFLVSFWQQMNNNLSFKTKICFVVKILFELTQPILETTNIDFPLEDDSFYTKVINQSLPALT